MENQQPPQADIEREQDQARQPQASQASQGAQGATQGGRDESEASERLEPGATEERDPAEGARDQSTDNESDEADIDFEPAAK